MRQTRKNWIEYRRLCAKLSAWRREDHGARPLTAREDRRYFNLASIYG